MLACSIAMAMLPTGTALADTWNGTDSNTEWTTNSEGHYLIATAADLAGLAAQVNAGNTYAGATFVLTDDIDLANNSWQPIGYMEMQGATGNNAEGNKKFFAGTFDGAGHSITGCYVHIDEMSSTSMGRITTGLFGGIKGDAKIMNLTLKNSSFYVKSWSWYAYGGALVGYSEGGTITNCLVTDNTVQVDAPQTTGSWIFEVKWGNAYAGGICGWAKNTTVAYCYASNTVIPNGSKNNYSSDFIVDVTPTACYSSDYATAVATLNDHAWGENIVRQAAPLHCSWNTEATALLTDRVVALDPNPAIAGGGEATVYCETAVERTVEGTNYLTVTSNDVIGVRCVAYQEPTAESNGYELNGLTVLRNGGVWDGVELSTNYVDEYVEYTFSGANGNISVAVDYIPTYLLTIETNGISDAFIYGDVTYIAHEGELVSIALTTDTIYNTYYYIESITCNGEDISDLVVLGAISTVEFYMPATAVTVYVDFGYGVISAVSKTETDALAVWGATGCVIARTAEPTPLSIVALDGRTMWQGVITGETTLSLPRGIYLANGKKVVVK